MQKLIAFSLLLSLTACGNRQDAKKNADVTVPGKENEIQSSQVIQEIKIGNQTWMQTNLDVSTYRNGDAIPEEKDPEKWDRLTTGAWCYYNNDPENGKTYGKLYNWYAVNDSRGLAPVGWHIPGEEEWATLANFLGGDSLAGDKLKETGNTHWKEENAGATNSSGFTALPGGFRDANRDGKFMGLGGDCYLWSSKSQNDWSGWRRDLSGYNSDLGRSQDHKVAGLSVRCLKD